MTCINRLRLDRWLLVGLVGALVAGCGEDASGGGPDGGPDGGGTEVTVAEFCDALRAAAETHCSPVPEDCEAALARGRTRCDTLEGSVDAGRIVLDGQQAKACLDTASAEGLAAFYHLGYLGEAECMGLLSGTLEAGSDCYHDYGFGVDECDADSHCPHGTECPSTCTAYRRLDQSCGEDGRCEPELACVFECVSGCDGTCQEPPGEGERCDLSVGRCAEGLLCDAQQDPSRCIEPKGAEEPCTAAYQCESRACHEGSCLHPDEVCSSTEDCTGGEVCGDASEGGRVCVPRADEGEACVPDYDMCVSGLQCLRDYETDGEAYRCHARAGIDGEPCLPWGCDEDHYCAAEGEDDVCRPRRGMDEGCLDQSFVVPEEQFPCQDGLHCMHSSTGTCLPPGEEGDPCAYDEFESCLDGLVCLGWVDSSCEPPAAVGESCETSFSDPCADGHCTCISDGMGGCTWECVALLDNGDPCEDGNQCISGHCDFSASSPVCAPAPPPYMLCLP